MPIGTMMSGELKSAHITICISSSTVLSPPAPAVSMSASEKYPCVTTSNSRKTPLVIAIYGGIEIARNLSENIPEDQHSLWGCMCINAHRAVYTMNFVLKFVLKWMNLYLK